jgi:hypothetical protein
LPCTDAEVARMSFDGLTGDGVGRLVEFRAPEHKHLRNHDRRSPRRRLAGGIYNGIYYCSEMQQWDDFEWDIHNEEKLAARHGVDSYEAEQAATDTGAIIKRIGSVWQPRVRFRGQDGRRTYPVYGRSSQEESGLAHRQR